VLSLQVHMTIRIDDSLTLRVHNFGGHLCTVTADRNWKAHDVYGAVEAATEIPKHELRLFFGAEELRGSDPLITIFECPNVQDFDVMLIQKRDPFVRLDGFKVSNTSNLVSEEVMTVVEAKAKLAEDTVQHGQAPRILDGTPSCFTFETKSGSDVLLKESAHISFYNNVISFDFVDPSRGGPDVHHTYVRLSLDSDDERRTFMNAVMKSATALQNVPEALLSEHTFILQAVQANAEALRYAMGGLKEDTEIILAAVNQNGFSLSHANAELRSNRHIVLAAVQRCGHALCYASDSLRADREVVLAAVRQNGHALQCAAEQLRSDPEIVLTAVRQNGHALQYAGEDLRMDETIFQTAFRQAGDRVLRYVPRRMAGKVKEQETSSLFRQWQILRGEVRSSARACAWRMRASLSALPHH
jgi:hypothetical protein